MINIKRIIEIVLLCIFGVSFYSISSTVTNRVIYIDPGHGGYDGGCVGYDETKEKDINLKISLELRDCLINLGYVVEITRVGDYDLSSSKSFNRKKDDLDKRIKMMNSAFLFVSIHANSYPGKVRGAQTFYNNEDGKILSTFIQDKIIEMFNNTSRSPQSLHSKYLLNNINTRGCIIEVGFLSSKEELNLLKDPSYQKNMAYAIALGIIDYINYYESLN